MTRTRAYRRHQDRRWKGRVKFMVKHQFQAKPQDVERIVNAFYRNRQPNGRCVCCGNQRFMEGDTVQERRAASPDDWAQP